MWKNVKKVWKKCEKVWKSAETNLPFSCCSLVFQTFSLKWFWKGWYCVSPYILHALIPSSTSTKLMCKWSKFISMPGNLIAASKIDARELILSCSFPPPLSVKSPQAPRVSRWKNFVSRPAEFVAYFSWNFLRPLFLEIEGLRHFFAEFFAHVGEKFARISLSGLFGITLIVKWRAPI